MKKHVSLFLALLMIFSVLFAFPVEAAQSQNVQAAQSVVSVTVSEHCAAPRVTDPETGINGSVVPPNPGDNCSHTYKTVQNNASNHKRVCTKCGYTTYVSHTLKYTSQSATQHKKYCSVCGYSAVVSHSIKYQNCGNTHQKYCSLCGYTTGETHTYGSTYTSLTANLHSVACTKCGGTKTEKHTFSYSDYGSTHNKHCRCGYSVTESHSNSGPVSINASVHKYTCTRCGHSYQEGHTWGYSDTSNPLYHNKYCTKCQYSAGLECHDLYVWMKAGYRADNGTPFRAILRCRNCTHQEFGDYPDPYVH